MFGLPSLQKLIVLAAVIAAVWYGFKFLGRLQQARKEEAKLREAQGGRPARKSGQDAGGQGAGEKAQAGDSSGEGNRQVEDLVQCPACGAYIAAGSTCSCGRQT